MKRLIPHVAIAGVVAMIVGGCTVRNDLRSPEFAAPRAYTSAPLPPQTVGASTRSGEAQRFTFVKTLPGQWWTLFRSPTLDDLIKLGLAGNPSLSSAQAALREAEENLRAATGNLRYPSVDGSLQASRQRVTAASGGGGSSYTFNLYNASVNVSYTLDLFGGIRNQLAALAAQVDYQRYQLEAAYLSLTANIATAAITEASLRERIRATEEILDAQQKQLEIVKRQFEIGAVPKSSVLSQQTELAKTRATLPPLQKQLATTRHALAVLTGRLPGDARLPEFRLDSLKLPVVLPVTLPSELAHQRPDIRAAEALLRQAAAQVGVATANLYPQITLSGGYGFEADHPGQLFNGRNVIWNIGAGLLQPIFNAGELSAKRRAAIAAYDQAAAQYRQIVLRAFQNVADVLRAIETDARMLRAQAEAETAAKATLDLTQQQFELGAVNYLSLLVAQRDFQAARISLIQAQADRFSDTAALFQALGGQWWKDPAISANAAPAQNMD